VYPYVIIQPTSTVTPAASATTEFLQAEPNKKDFVEALPRPKSAEIAKRIKEFTNPKNS
jgi:hypothetical protein